MNKHAKRHRRMKWFWVFFGVVGVADYVIRGDIAILWEKPIANSIVWLFIISVAALIIGEWAAEEAASDD